IPLSVSNAGGPHSVSEESKYPSRGIINFASSPFSLSTGSQFSKSSETAPDTPCSPQYIKYFPFTFVITSRLSRKEVTIEADLCGAFSTSMKFAFLKIGPCLSQCIRSRDVATPKRGTSLSHCV